MDAPDSTSAGAHLQQELHPDNHSEAHTGERPREAEEHRKKEERKRKRERERYCDAQYSSTTVLVGRQGSAHTHEHTQKHPEKRDVHRQEVGRM